MRTALITGASRGIGRGVARELATQGFGLTVTSRKGQRLRELAADLLAAGAAEVVPVAADLADRDGVGAVVEAHESAFGTMNALVLSGGVGTAAPFADLPAGGVERTFAVNTLSAVAAIQHALPLLRKAAACDVESGARVVALASITGVVAEPRLAAYGASKAALISLIETLNAEESANGVMATAIAPGYVATDMSQWITAEIPADTMLQVSDVVEVVTMLLRLGRTASITRIVMTRSGSSHGA
jgi:NAD(P)-dependent dehydrogenase (short-subunit alcohol dehydrogenase family)